MVIRVVLDGDQSHLVPQRFVGRFLNSCVFRLLPHVDITDGVNVAA